MYMLYWPDVLVELREGREGSPPLRAGEVGHNFALSGDHVAVDVQPIRLRARERSPVNWEQDFVIGVSNVMTHEIGHRFMWHTSTHDFMTEGGAESDSWLFDPSLSWPE